MHIPVVCLFVVLALSGVVSAAEEALVPRFDIQRIQLEGNTILQSQEVVAMLSKYVGPQKDFGTLQEVLEELEAAYRTRGYNLVTVLLPEQELVGGVVTIKVLEPVVRSVLIEGNQYYDRDNILRSLPTLRSSMSPQLVDISENLRAANEIPSKKLALRFKAQDKPEDLHAIVHVTDEKPWKLILNGDNTGNDPTGDFRVGVGAQYDNLWNLDHVVALQYTSSPTHPSDVLNISGSYRIPFYGWGDTLDLYGGYSDQDSSFSISGIGITTTGRGTIAGARYTFNMPRQGSFDHKIMLGSDYRRYELSNDLASTETTVATYPTSMTYGWNWQAERFNLDGYVGAATNQRWGGQSDRRQFEAVRPGATPNYWVFRYGVNSMAKVGSDWLVRVFGNGQYSWDRLIPGEQFGLGGAASVRGYEEREEAWDAGFAGSAEVYSPDIMRLVGQPRTQLRALAFFDGGYGYNLRAQAYEEADNYLVSAGIGLRMSYGENVSAAVDWGCALRDSTALSLVQDATRVGDSRFHFKIQFIY